MSEPFIGEIRLVGFNFAPQGWALCDGRMLSISQHQALFVLLGTMYGGNGQTTFALPDLRGRAPVGMGPGPGHRPRTTGEAFGQEAVTLMAAQLPPHTHDTAYSLPHTEATEATPDRPIAYKVSDPTAPTTPLPSLPTGQGLPVETVPPSIAMNYVIALQGIFPSRS